MLRRVRLALPTRLVPVLADKVKSVTYYHTPIHLFVDIVPPFHLLSIRQDDPPTDLPRIQGRLAPIAYIVHCWQCIYPLPPHPPRLPVLGADPLDIKMDVGLKLSPPIQVPAG